MKIEISKSFVVILLVAWIGWPIWSPLFCIIAAAMWTGAQWVARCDIYAVIGLTLFGLLIVGFIAAIPMLAKDVFLYCKHLIFGYPQHSTISKPDFLSDIARMNRERSDHDHKNN